ncbi:hypothetical protein K435DRAFT_775012 [Dendrothele bispora CBS 962.96]|uniref:Uncharacterized protein n=1 Tax=Dendrothele bispora (strain CBS 962.96) TaxID=1314807 RepID=A0A4S8MKK5_DENBC|nr:hypothetical protein K435DRAFT_775012 [Dendrothele bispora CBS 962.96]
MSSRVAKTLQQASSHSRLFRRHLFSSSPSFNQPKIAHSLPPEKMRALISLYHQADTFITKENLSDRIDEAFTGLSKYPGLPVNVPGFSELNEQVWKQQTAPKFSEWDMERALSGATAVPTSDGYWSGSLSMRDWKVVEALYGVDVSDSKSVMPGLEALEEHAKLKEDDSEKSFDEDIEEDLKERMQRHS